MIQPGRGKKSNPAGRAAVAAGFGVVSGAWLLLPTPAFAQATVPAPQASPAQPPQPKPTPGSPPGATPAAPSRAVRPPALRLFSGDLPKPTPGVKPVMPPSTANRRPDLFAPLPFYEKRDNYFFRAEGDLRYRTLSASGQKETIGTYIAASRFTADYIRANPRTGDERGGARLQFLLESDNLGTSLNRLRMSEAYLFYRFLFPGVSANVRAGQFVLPFGLIAIYDTPLEPIQPLYQLSLGLRVDTGIMLEGDYGPYHYATSLTRGVGPDKNDEDETGVLAFRLSRVFAPNYKRFRLGQVQLGGSLLSGRMPVTGFSTVLPASGFTGAHGPSGYIKKTRFGADGVYQNGPFVGRGEIIFGADDQESVWGYFTEGDLRILPGVTLVGYGRRWNFPVQPERSQTFGAGLNFNLGSDIVLRSLFEYEEQIPAQSDQSRSIIRRVTLQTRLRF